MAINYNLEIPDKSGPSLFFDVCHQVVHKFFENRLLQIWFHCSNLFHNRYLSGLHHSAQWELPRGKNLNFFRPDNTFLNQIARKNGQKINKCRCYDMSRFFLMFTFLNPKTSPEKFSGNTLRVRDFSEEFPMLRANSEKTSAVTRLYCTSTWQYYCSTLSASGHTHTHRKKILVSHIIPFSPTNTTDNHAISSVRRKFLASRRPRR